MNRKTAREVALQIVFEIGFPPMVDAENLDFRLSDKGMEQLANAGGLFKLPVPADSREYIESTVRGVADYIYELDELIEKYAEGWSVTRVSKMAKSILRLALYEIKYGETPTEVAINEAIDITKKFDADDAAPAFINGILGSYVRATE